MATIQIVQNTDRTHVSIDGTPVKTFMHWNYDHKNPSQQKSHALHDAMAECFLQLHEIHEAGLTGTINTEIKVS